MKKSLLLLSLGLLLSSSAVLAVPAETTGGASHPVRFAVVKRILREKQLNSREEFVPYVYKPERLKFKNVGAHQKPVLPGVNYKKLCYHWKNCVKRIYKASNGYDRAYERYTPVKPEQKKLDLAFLPKKNLKAESDVRSGVYKLWHWRFITPRNH